MQESSVYQYIIEQGREEGREEGERKGREEGERISTVESILELLSIRFQIETTEAMKSDIESIRSLQRLKQLRRAAAEVRSLDAFMHILKNGSVPV